MTEILAILLTPVYRSLIVINQPALLEVLPPLASHELHLDSCYDGRERPDPSGWP